MLTRSNVLSAAGDDQDGDVVVMSSEELLSPRDNVPHDDGSSEGEENVFIVRVENQSTVHLACHAKEMIRPTIRARMPMSAHLP